MASEEIQTKIIQVDPNGVMSQILHDGQGTKCNSYLGDCHNFQYETHIIKKRPDGKIIPEQVQIGLCRLTGVACLKVAEMIAKTTSTLRQKVNLLNKRW